MWVIQLIASVAMLNMNNRKAKYGECLAKALDDYVAFSDDAGRQFWLEQIFCQIYRKKASAELIRKMASSSMGPFEAFDIYARSSLHVRCDYHKDSVRIPNFALTGATGYVLKAVFGLIAAVSGATCLVLSVVPTLSLLKAGVALVSANIQDVSFDMTMNALLWMVVLFVMIVFTIIFFFLSSLSLLTDRTQEAIQLAEEVNDH